MKLNLNWSEIDWCGWLKAVAKASIPFVSGLIGGILAGCSIMGSGVGMTC